MATHSYFQFLEWEGVEEAGLACTSDKEEAPEHLAWLTHGAGGLCTGLRDQCAPPQKHYRDNSTSTFGYSPNGVLYLFIRYFTR
jgi:hypothetical protein